MATERTVYVLDDDDAVLRSLERLLSSANFEPISFERPELFLTAAAFEMFPRFIDGLHIPVTPLPAAK